MRSIVNDVHQAPLVDVRRAPHTLRSSSFTRRDQPGSRVACRDSPAATTTSSSSAPTSRSTSDSGVAPEVADSRHAQLRHAISSSIQYSLKPVPNNRTSKQGPNGASSSKGSSSVVTGFFHKVHLAWRIFFPDQPEVVSAKEEGKRRLRMILVADRCGMSPASMSEMKKTIMRALADYIDIDSEDNIEVAISTDPGLGTVYSVAIPVRRVKPEARFGSEGELEGSADGVSLEWDPADWNSDPSARFPMGC